MDVFKIGAGAPKAPESRTVDRDVESTNKGERARASDAAVDQFSASADAVSVDNFVSKLGTVTDVREDVIRGFRELLGRGLLDSAESARRAADGILDA